MRRGSAAVDAFVVFVRFGDGEEFGAGFWVDFPQFGGHLGAVLPVKSWVREECDEVDVVEKRESIAGFVSSSTIVQHPNHDRTMAKQR